MSGAPALRSLEKGVSAFSSAEGVLRVRVAESLERVWSGIDMLGTAATRDIRLKKMPPTLPTNHLRKRA